MGLSYRGHHQGQDVKQMEGTAEPSKCSGLPKAEPEQTRRVEGRARVIPPLCRLPPARWSVATSKSRANFPRERQWPSSRTRVTRPSRPNEETKTAFRGDCQCEITRQHVRLGDCVKWLLLAQTYVGTVSGLWSPPAELPHVLLEGHSGLGRPTTPWSRRRRAIERAAAQR